MDPEFKRILFRVMLLGGAILAIGAGTLLVAFHAYGPAQERGREFRPSLLIAVLLVFVLTVCVVLLRMSMVR